MQNSTFQPQGSQGYQDFLASKRSTSAYRPPIAPIGSHIRIRIAAQLLRDEGTYGFLVSYPNARFAVRRENVKTLIDREERLLLCELDATLVSHDGRVGYVVRVGQHELRVHAQMVEVCA